MKLQDDPFASIKLIAPKMNQIGYTIETFNIEPLTYYIFTKEGRNSWMTRGEVVSYPFTHSGLVNLSVHKNRAYDLLKHYKITVPETYTCSRGHVSVITIEQMIKKYGRLIVKPSDASLSNGLSMNLSSTEQVLTAIDNAFNHVKLSNTILIQQQVSGDEIRFVVVNNRVKAALLRRAPNVVGDGVSTIKELLRVENIERSKINLQYVRYPELTSEIIDKNYFNSEVMPAKNNRIMLANSSMIQGGASIYNVFNNVHISYMETAEYIASLVGAAFIVVDMLINDYTKAQAPSNHCFLELNTAPEIKLFYSCRDDNHYDVLTDLIPMIDSNLTIL